MFAEALLASKLFLREGLNKGMLPKTTGTQPGARSGVVVLWHVCVARRLSVGRLKARQEAEIWVHHPARRIIMNNGVSGKSGQDIWCSNAQWYGDDYCNMDHHLSSEKRSQSLWKSSDRIWPAAPQNTALVFRNKALERGRAPREVSWAYQQPPTLCQCVAADHNR